MKKFISATLLISAILALAAIPAFAQSTQATVTIVGHAFNPTETNISTGGRVTWHNTDPVVHTATSNAGQAVSWDSGNLGQGQSYSVVFNNPGTFNYFCTLHAWMTGRVVVSGAAQSSPTPAVSDTPSPSSAAAAAVGTTATPSATATAPASAATPATPVANVPSTGGSDASAGETDRIFVFAGLGVLITTLSYGIWNRRRSIR